MNEELPDWSVRLSLVQTLSWHFNGVPGTVRRQCGNEQVPTSCPAGQDGKENVWRLQCGSAQEYLGLQKNQGRWRDRGGEIGEQSRHPSIKKTPHRWQLRCMSGLLCTWARRANDEEKHQTTKRGHNDATVLTAPADGVSSSSLLCRRLCAPRHHLHLHLHQQGCSLIAQHLSLPLNPPLWAHTERCSQKRPEDGREGVMLIVKGSGWL